MGCCHCNRRTSGSNSSYYYENKIKEKDDELKKKDETIEEKDKKLKEKDDEIQKKDKEIEELKSESYIDKNSQNCDSESVSSSVSSVPPKIQINIEFNGGDYEFMVKDEYELSKVLHRFKKQNKNLKPKGKFYFKGNLFDDLSKTCGDIGIEDGVSITLE